MKYSEIKNSFELSYMSSTELKNIFVIGDFGVSPDLRIIDEPEKLSLGDWGLQGYYHYHAGIKYFYSMTYKKDMGTDGASMHLLKIEAVI